eukprot:TRINITY_DN9099_c0_g3_i1.p1 TRINITY_DN9099_c0_g3~~TRINITY_DN9099_c0_g3_i1.p1  ORF type:complete len:570 (+),score=126.89 TRINITY_DN9099_c0_g3_i1:343-2052(+)
MGLGKTAVTLAFLDLHERLKTKANAGTNIRPTLVVVPASLLENWEAETRTWCPHFRLFKYYASAAAERGALAAKFFAEHHGRCHLVLTTPGVLHNQEDRAAFFRKVQFDYLVCDEAHGLKNAGSQRFRDVDRGINVESRLLLTGTPVQNSLRELANLLTLLLAADSSSSGSSRSAKSRARQAAVEELSDLAERGVLRTLQARAAPLILRRLKRDVMAELPAKTGKTVLCNLSEPQRQLYERELEAAKAAAAAKGKRQTAKAFVQSLFHRLRRVCNHPLMGQTRLEERDYQRLVELLCQVRPDFQRAKSERAMAEVKSWSDFEVAQAVAEYNLLPRLGPGFDAQRFSLSRADLAEGSSKVQKLLELLRTQREAKRKTLVFSQFTQYLDLISAALKVEGFRHARLDGSTNVDARAHIVQEFQREDSGIDVFLLSTKAGGVGLNLTAADSVALMDLSFNPHDNRQAEDRVHRLGQTRPVSVHYFVCSGTVEESVLRVNLSKLSLDRQFGGQRSLLRSEGPASASGVACVGDAARAEDNSDQEEEEPAADPAASKQAEQEVLAELAREFSAPV